MTPPVRKENESGWLPIDVAGGMIILFPKYPIEKVGDVEEIIIDKGCDLTIHKEMVVACMMGSGITKEIRTFSTKCFLEWEA